MRPVELGTSVAPQSKRSALGNMWWLLSNSPWIAIAVLAHVIAIAVMGIISITGGAERKPPAASTIMSWAPPVAPALLIEPPESLRERIGKDIPEVLPGDKPGEFNPRDDVIPGAEPGPIGEDGEYADDPTRDAGMLHPDTSLPFDPMATGPGGNTPIGVGGPGRRDYKGVSELSGRGNNRRGGGGPGGGGGGRGGEILTVAMPAALEWLANHQSPDGRWDADGFDSRCRNGKCSGPGESVYDTGLTGLALLCFLGAGETHQAGPYKETVKSGLKYLRSVQDAEGCLTPRTSQHFQYNHACAALAMVEAYGMTQSKVWHDPAQKSIGFIQTSQNPYLAWRYGVRDGDNDTSVTGWMVMALKSGKMSGLEVDTGAFKGAVDWVEKMTDPEFGKVGYQQRGGQPARTTAMQDKFPANQSEALTAVGVLVRVFAGADAEKDPMVAKGAELMSKKLPRWDVDAGTIDFYYWYYGTLAMFQVGGEPWRKWNAAMKTAIVDHQRLDGESCTYGSWDPEDPWSSEGGRVYATALNCLCSEVYHRYPRVFGAPLPAPEKK